MKKSLVYLARAAVIAALYFALSVAFNAIAFGPVQFRVSEILVLLPLIFPEAIPGLAIGCFFHKLLFLALRRVRHGSWHACNTHRCDRHVPFASQTFSCNPSADCSKHLARAAHFRAQRCVDGVLSCDVRDFGISNHNLYSFGHALYFRPQKSDDCGTHSPSAPLEVRHRSLPPHIAGRRRGRRGLNCKNDIRKPRSREAFFFFGCFFVYFASGVKNTLPA